MTHALEKLGYNRSEVFRRQNAIQIIDILLGLKTNELAMFHTIEDAYIARNIAYKLTHSPKLDTKDNHYYFRTSHKKGREHNCVLVIQRIKEDSPHLSIYGRRKRRYYQSGGKSGVKKIDDFRKSSGIIRHDYFLQQLTTAMNRLDTELRMKYYHTKDF